MTRITVAAILALACALSVSGQPDRGKDCDRTSTGMTPIDLMTSGDLYKDMSGGLYPDGTNDPPPRHLADLVAAFENLPSTVGFTSAGMSNCEQVWAGKRSPDPADATSFMGKAAPAPGVVLISAAQGGLDALNWPEGGSAWDEVPNRLALAGVSADEVIFCWAHHALSPRDGMPKISETQAAISAFARQAKVKWPNLRVIYLSSGNYHGYATGDLAEPHSYDTGWACKLTIAAQIKQRGDGVVDNTSGDLRYWDEPGEESPKAPIITWGPYVWRDGLPHWTCDDTVDDGVHPTRQAPGLGQDKWSDQLLAFFMKSPTAGPWFNADWKEATTTGEYTCADGDLNGDGRIDGADLMVVLANWDTGTPNGAECKPRYDQTKQSGTDAALAAEMEARGWLPLPLLYEGRLWDGDSAEPSGFNMTKTADTLADIDVGSRILLDVEEWDWFKPSRSTDLEAADFVASYLEMIAFIRTVRPDLIIGAYQIPHTLMLNSNKYRTWMFDDIMAQLDFSAPVFYPKFGSPGEPFDVDLAAKHAQFDTIFADYSDHGIPFYALGAPAYDSDSGDALVMREVPEEWKDDYVSLWDRGEALIFFSNMGKPGQRTWPDLETEEQQSAAMRRWLEIIDTVFCND